MNYYKLFLGYCSTVKKKKKGKWALVTCSGKKKKKSHVFINYINNDVKAVKWFYTNNYLPRTKLSFRRLAQL